MWLSFFSHKHITSLLPPLHTEVVYDLASGQAGSSGNQNKAIWFLRPYAAPTLNNRPGETTPSRSRSQPRSFLASVRKTQKPLTFQTILLNLLSYVVFDSVLPTVDELLLQTKLTCCSAVIGSRLPLLNSHLCFFSTLWHTGSTLPNLFQESEINHLCRD